MRSLDTYSSRELREALAGSLAQAKRATTPGVRERARERATTIRAELSRRGPPGSRAAMAAAYEAAEDRRERARACPACGHVA